MAFRITGLPSETFAPLFALTDAELAAQGGVRRAAQGREPCRISLTDAAPGAELILVNQATALLTVANRISSRLTSSAGTGRL